MFYLNMLDKQLVYSAKDNNVQIQFSLFQALSLTADARQEVFVLTLSLWKMYQSLVENRRKDTDGLFRGLMPYHCSNNVYTWSFICGGGCGPWDFSDSPLLDLTLCDFGLGLCIGLVNTWFGLTWQPERCIVHVLITSEVLSNLAS